jgi:hypothetical protein
MDVAMSAIATVTALKTAFFITPRDLEIAGAAA